MKSKKIIEKKIIIKSNDCISESSASDVEIQSSDLEIQQLSVPHLSRQDIEKIAGTSVGDLMLYRRAFVHKSIQKLIKNTTGETQEYMKESSERLEFVGDSILGAIIADWLFQKYPKNDEGFLTTCRTRIVKSSTLSYFAEQVGMKGKILMGQQVVNMGGMENDRFLEDAFEAFIGAMYYDKGFDGVKKFVIGVIEKHISEDTILRDENFKDLLLRYAQFIKTELPIYNIIKEQGQPHNKEFVIDVIVFGERQGKGRAKKIKDAEQIAAKEAIKRLGITDNFNK